MGYCLTDEQIQWAISIYNHSYSVKEIANACNVSDKTMRRYFEEYIGEKPYTSRKKEVLIAPWNM